MIDTIGNKVAGLTPMATLIVAGADAILRRDAELSQPLLRAQSGFQSLIEAAQAAEVALRGTDAGGRLAAAIQRVTG